jgi:hypothetical protein
MSRVITLGLIAAVLVLGREVKNLADRICITEPVDEVGNLYFPKFERKKDRSLTLVSRSTPLYEWGGDDVS